MTWADIHFDTGEIYINEDGKTGPRRPVAETNVLAYLKLQQKNNPTQPLIPAVGLARRQDLFRKAVKKGLGIDWIQDGLRHTCVTNFYALHKSWDKVEYQFGHSVQVSKKHYQRSIPQAECDSFWKILD